MSQGRKFSKEDTRDLSPEERLALLESKLPILIERIQSYDKIVEAYDSLKFTFDKLSKAVSDSNESLSKVANAHEALKSKSHEDIKLLSMTVQKANENVLEIIRHHKEISGKVNRSIEDKEVALEKIKNQMTTISSAIVPRGDFHSAVNSLKTEIVGLKDETRVRGAQVKELKDKLAKHEESHTSLKSDIEKVDKKISSVNSDFSVFPNQIKNLSDSLTYDMNNRLMSFYEKVNTRLDAVAQKLVPEGTSINLVRDEMSHKIEMFRIDIQNSVLKASNNSTQINLVEKKVENLRLLLNRYCLESDKSIPIYEEGGK